jgi:helix-turn-helix protein
MPNSPRANYTTSRDKSLTVSSRFAHLGEGQYGMLPLAWAPKMRKLGLRAVLVYWILCGHADSKGRCYPSIKTIARETGLPDRHVSSALRDLEKLGALQTISKQGHSSTYCLTSPPPTCEVVTDSVRGEVMTVSVIRAIYTDDRYGQGGGDQYGQGGGDQYGQGVVTNTVTHNRPRNRVFNRTSDDKEKTNDESRTPLTPMNEVAERFFAQQRARFGIKNPPSPSKVTP